ncbi:neural cell adhesion molecule L1-like [Hemitrygon akajei]|uniref:neural cell adhesion molecule L1-like n=1 Tax=Hemitrygon akajei TaxID=2704970 RepID=UPI003BF959A9
MLSLVLQFVLVVVNAEAEREEVVGVPGSSVLLDPEITVDSSKNEILWTFKASNENHDVILNHVPGVATLEPSEQFKDRLQFNALSGALMISRLSARDQGDYTFTVDGKELKIMELLVIDTVKEEVGLLGSSVLLDPELKVDPSKSEIVWMFIDRSILHHVPGHSLVELSEQFEFRLQFNTSNGALTVNGTEHGDQGDYTFIVDGQELRIIQLRLVDELSEASIFTNIESLGFTVELTCEVFGDSNVYQWQKNGGEISQHHQLTDENRTLVIPSASSEDCGVYTCITTNPVSSIQTNYTLMLRGLSLNDVILITVLTAGHVISGPSLRSAMLPDQWRWKTLGVPAKPIEEQHPLFHIESQELQ